MISGVWIDEAADIHPDRARLLAYWSYRNVLSWPMPLYSFGNTILFGDPRVEPRRFEGLEPRYW